MSLTRLSAGPRNGFIVVVTIATIALAIFAFGRPASAATQSVNVGTPTNRFTANVITINAGDTVTFNWSAGTHVVDLMDISPDLPIDSGHTSGVTVPLKTPGTYYFYCSIHATAAQATEAHVQANDAMVGKIVVVAAANSGSATASPSGSPAAPSAGSGVALHGSSSAWMFVLAAGLLAATGIIGGTIATARRRQG